MQRLLHVVGDAAGQDNFGQGEENRGGTANGASFRWPHALAATDTHLYIADAGNHRILGWRLPLEADRPADRVLGQPDFKSNGEDHRKSVGQGTLCWSYGVHLHWDRLIVADSGNNRLIV